MSAKEKARKERARAAKKAKVEAMVKRAEKKRRWRWRLAVVLMCCKFMLGALVVGLGLGGAYFAACGTLWIKHQAGEGLNYVRLVTSDWIAPRVEDSDFDELGGGILGSQRREQQRKEDSVQIIKPLVNTAYQPRLTPDEIDAMIDHYAGIYEIDADTARGILMQESSYREEAVNGDAHGMAQLREQARDYCGITEAQAKDARFAIPCFFSWLSQKKHEQDGDDAEAVQSYYCGPCENPRGCKDRQGRWVPPCINAPRGIGYLKQVVKRYGARPEAPRMVEAQRESRVRING